MVTNKDRPSGVGVEPVSPVAEPGGPRHVRGFHIKPQWIAGVAVIAAPAAVYFLRSGKPSLYRSAAIVRGDIESTISSTGNPRWTSARIAASLQAAILAAFIFSALTGIFFGYYPARKAAWMDPIEALRYE